MPWLVVVVMMMMMMMMMKSSDGVISECNSACECFTGCFLVVLNAVNVILAFTKCYPMNGQEYCFYTNGSVLSWDEAREFCMDSTLPIITDKNIDNVFQQFIADNNNVEMSGSDTEQVNNYVWLDARTLPVENSDEWHWINSQPSGSNGALVLPYETYFCIGLLGLAVAAAAAYL